MSLIKSNRPGYRGCPVCIQISWLQRPAVEEERRLCDMASLGQFPRGEDRFCAGLRFWVQLGRREAASTPTLGFMKTSLIDFSAKAQESD